MPVTTFENMLNDSEKEAAFSVTVVRWHEYVNIGNPGDPPRHL